MSDNKYVQYWNQYTKRWYKVITGEHTWNIVAVSPAKFEDVPVYDKNAKPEKVYERENRDYNTDENPYSLL